MSDEQLDTLTEICEVCKVRHLDYPRSAFQWREIGSFAKPTTWHPVAFSEAVRYDFD